MKVFITNTSNLDIGMLIAVTGISGLEKEGEIFNRIVRTRQPTDIVVLAP